MRYKKIKIGKEYAYKQWTWCAEQAHSDDSEMDIFIGGRYFRTVSKLTSRDGIERHIEKSLERLKDLADIFQIQIEEF